MKQTILIISILLTLFSCQNRKNTPENDLAKLQADKSKIQQQVDSLNRHLKQIEKAMHQLDTLKQTQKVTIFTVKDTLFNHYIALHGVVSSDKNVVLRPEMGGTIQRIFVKEGQSVRRGQMLLKLDASSLTDKVAELKTQLSLAKTTFERQERLWNQKIGSEMQYLNAKTQKEALESSLNSLYTQIGKTKIKAPFSGVIEAIIPKVGELIGPQSSVIRLINLASVYVEADVPETYLTALKKGTPVLIDFTSIDKQISSKISKIGNYINSDNRSFKIRIPVTNKNQSIKPNLLADLRINDYSAVGIVLPSNLIQMNQKGESFVYSITRDSVEIKVVKRVLELGKEYDHHVLVKNGLKVDEELVRKGGKFVKDGDVVEISITNDN